MKIAALSLILSTSFLAGMLNENSTQEEINAYNAGVNSLYQDLKEQREEWEAQDKRIERTENPLTRFMLAMRGRRKSYDGPNFQIPYDVNTSEIERIKKFDSISWDTPKVTLICFLKVTGDKKIAAVKAELNKIIAHCREQEKNIRPIATNSEQIIADEFASATFSIKDDELRWEISSCFPSEGSFKHWADYETYIPYK